MASNKTAQQRRRKEKVITPPQDIRYVDWGIANNFGTHIELHKDLKNYPDLHAALLNHEMAHSRSSGFTMHDLTVDLKPTKGLSRHKLFWFTLTRPKTWIQWLPVYYQKDKGIVYDINAITIYSIMVLLIGITGYFIFRILNFLS